MATGGHNANVDDQDTNRVNQTPEGAWQKDQARQGAEEQDTSTGNSSVAACNPAQQTEAVITSEVGLKDSGEHAATTSLPLSEGLGSKNNASHDSTLLNSNANGTVCSTKHKRQPMTMPRETKASQLRLKSHSSTENKPDNPSVKRQNSLPSSKPQSPGSHSTSSEESFERDRMESAPLSSNRKMRDNDSTSPNPNKGKGGGHDCVSPYGPATEKYLTPLQQKERHNKELSIQISKLEQTVLNLEQRIRQFEQEKQKALEDAAKVKDTEMGKLLIEIKNLQIHLEESKNSRSRVSDSLSDEQKMTASLKEQMTTMQREHEEREAVHQKRYLEMYQKGREAQLIDQEEDLICMAIATAPAGDGQNRHLVKKLERTEKELEKLRQTFREDVYHKTPQLDTDSAAQVEILKSAVYYYLTDTQPEVNLNVMLSMLSYSDVQRKNIISHIKKKSK